MSLQTPVRPGTLIGFSGKYGLGLTPSPGNTVAVAITHDWGPENQLVTCESYEGFTQIFGEDNTAGRNDVASAFSGQGIAGGTGAGTVLVYRAVGTEGAQAKVELQNTTPAAALKLTANYKGVRGNKLTAKVSEDVAENTKYILEILYEGVMVSQYVFAKTNITELAELINADPRRWVHAEKLVTGVALALGTFSLTGGNNGETLTNAQVEAFLTALNYKRFAVLASRLFSTAELQAVALSWVKERLAKSRPVRWVVGGSATETISQAIARSATLAHSHVINLGKGKYVDSLTGETCSTLALSPRVAGALAALGGHGSLTFARFGTLSIAENSAPEGQEVVLGIEGGVTMLTVSTAAGAEVKCEQGLTTFTAKGSAEEPYETFSDPRLMAINDEFTNNVKEWGDLNSIGRVINPDTLAAVKGKVLAEQKELERQELIVPGSATYELLTPTPEELKRGPAKQEIRYRFGWTDYPTNLHLIGEGVVNG